VSVSLTSQQDKRYRIVCYNLLRSRSILPDVPNSPLRHSAVYATDTRMSSLVGFACEIHPLSEPWQHVPRDSSPSSVSAFTDAHPSARLSSVG
jgi:hypothetical protein